MLIGRFHGYAVFAEADHVIMQGNISGYDKKRAHDPLRGLAHAEVTYVALLVHRPFGASRFTAQELPEAV